MKNLDNVIDNYLQKGFGSMNKNDFEVWIFNYLMQNKLRGKSNLDISIELRIPESKVKRLKYESDLKYGNPQDVSTYIKELNILLSKAVIKRDGNSVQFVVENIQLRKFLDSELKKVGRFSNTSFNSEIISMDIDDLQFLLITLMSKGEAGDTCVKVEKELKEKNSLKKIVNKYIESMATQTGKIAIDLSVDGISKLINMFI